MPLQRGIEQRAVVRFFACQPDRYNVLNLSNMNAIQKNDPLAVKVINKSNFLGKEVDVYGDAINYPSQPNSLFWLNNRRHISTTLPPYLCRYQVFHSGVPFSNHDKGYTRLCILVVNNSLRGRLPHLRCHRFSSTSPST